MINGIRFFIFFTLLLPLKSSACLMAHIFKIYPVGIQNDTIWTVDFHIDRNDAYPLIEDSAYLTSIGQNLTFSSSKSALRMWNIKSYITAYNEHQEVLLTKAIDSTYFFKDDYLSELQYMYSKVFQSIEETNPNIHFFKPKTIINCKDRGNERKEVELNEGTFIYKNWEYPIEITKDSLYHGWNSMSPYHEIITSIPYPSMQSIVKYSIGKSELIVVHLQFGEDLIKTKRKKEKFYSIKKIYEEPILYHGQGYDLFFLDKNL